MKFTPTTVICKTFWHFYIKRMFGGKKDDDPWVLKTWNSYWLHNFIQGFSFLYSNPHTFRTNLYFLCTYCCILLKFSNKNRDKKKWYCVCSIFRKIGESWKSLELAYQKMHWFCVANKDLSSMNLITREIQAIYSKQKMFCNSWKKPIDQKYLHFKTAHNVKTVCICISLSSLYIINISKLSIHQIIAEKKFFFRSTGSVDARFKKKML